MRLSHAFAFGVPAVNRVARPAGGAAALAQQGGGGGPRAGGGGGGGGFQQANSRFNLEFYAQPTTSSIV